MNKEEALAEITHYQYTGNCYLETGRGGDRVFSAIPGSQTDLEAQAYCKSSSRWTFLGTFHYGKLETPVAELVIPKVHMNGTSKRDLLEQISNANHALILAIDKLDEMRPNARDYYLTDNFKEAQAQSASWLAKIREVKNAIMAIGEAIADQEE